MNNNVLAVLVGLTVILTGLIISYIFQKIFAGYSGKVPNAMESYRNREDKSDR